jgi:MtN3 and saliva related transmembrane protein
MEFYVGMIGSIAALLTMTGFVPQVIRMLRTKSVEDISLVALLQTWVGVVCWAMYAFWMKDPILLYANLFSTTVFSIALVTYFKYKVRN